MHCSPSRQYPWSQRSPGRNDGLNNQARLRERDADAPGILARVGATAEVVQHAAGDDGRCAGAGEDPHVAVRGVALDESARPAAGVCRCATTCAATHSLQWGRTVRTCAEVTAT